MNLIVIYSHGGQWPRHFFLNFWPNFFPFPQHFMSMQRRLWYSVVSLKLRVSTVCVKQHFAHLQLSSCSSLLAQLSVSSLGQCWAFHLLVSLLPHWHSAILGWEKCTDLFLFCFSFRAKLPIHGYCKKVGIHTTCKINSDYVFTNSRRNKTYRIYIITPSDHMSQLLSYFSGPRTSGAEK